MTTSKTTKRSPRFRAPMVAAFLSAALTLASLVNAAPPESNDRLVNQPKSDYRARRLSLMEKIKDGVVVLVGSRDEDFGEVGRFRQKNDFEYMTGVETPDAYLMLAPAGLIPDRPQHETLFIPKRDLTREKWTGVQVGPGADAEQLFGFQEVAASDTFAKRLGEIVSAPTAGGQGVQGSKQVKVYTIVPRSPEAELFREQQFLEMLRRVAPAAQLVDVSPMLAEMRWMKSPAEVALVQKAVDITGEAQHDVARMIKPGVFEYEAQAVVEYAFARNGAERPGFPSIIGSGINSTILHYMRNRKKIDAGDLVVVDIGAEYSYYTADITRTYPADGKFTRRQRDVYELVLEAQRAAEKAYKPGMTIYQLNQVARDVMKASPLRDKNGKTLEQYFIHGLGHWLGMDVHDVGGVGKPIKAGAIFTIEPGIYIPDESLGVRIEDDYLATETGLTKLSARIPSAPDDVERAMSQRTQSAGGQR